MAEQIRYNQLYDALSPTDQNAYAGYKIARNLVPSERDTQDEAFPDYKEILDAEVAANKTKPNMWNPMNWIFSPAESAMATEEERAAIERGSADIEYNAPNYLDSRSPITYPGQSPEGSYDMSRRYGLGDTSGVTSNYGTFGKHGEIYDPAFGELEQWDYWDTAYPGSFKAKGYYDTSRDIPNIQRYKDPSRFTLTDQGIAGLDVQENINTTDKWITPVEGARTIIKNPDYIPPEQWNLPDRDWGPVRRTEPRPRRNKFDLFLQKFGAPPMTQVTAADKLANKQFMGQKQIGINPQTGRMYGGDWNEASQDFAGKNAPGSSAYGSANFGEMAQKWVDDYGDVKYSQTVIGDMKRRKQARMKQRAADFAMQQQAARQEEIRNQRAAANAANQMTQRRPDMGGSHMSRPVDQGGLGISASQAQAVSDANAKASMGGWGLAHGGRVGYNTGGRVGILSVF